MAPEGRLNSVRDLMPVSETTSLEPRILIGICGGIAAYKVAAVVSALAQENEAVTVAMTRDSERFVGETTFASLSGRPVFRDPWTHQESPDSPHIALARSARVMLVAPCTMDMLGKLVMGRADDPVSLLAASIDRSVCPVLLAPSMNQTMLQQPATQRNLKVLEQDGFTIISPGTGWQACRTEGAGRMAEPEELTARIRQVLR